MNVKCIYLLLILCSCFAQAQNYMPLVAIDSVKTDIKVEKHVWVDGNTYLFIAISITGLPEINTVYSNQPSDSINSSIIIRDSFGGGYGL